MPEPGENESKEDFLDRCMGDEEANEDFPDRDQRFAFCNSQWERKHMSEKNAIKTIEKTEDYLRVGNYIVLFGGVDLEGEHFTPETALESAYTKTGMLYVDWEHGLGRVLDGDDAPGPDDILGVVDWKSVKVDDRGVWVERVLDRRNDYMEFLESLIDEELVGNSTEAVPDGVEKASNGEIIAWPLRRDTLTVMPAEPRMLSENAVTALKALAAKFPDLEALLPQDQAMVGAGATEPEKADKARKIKIKLKV